MDVTIGELKDVVYQPDVCTAGTFLFNILALRKLYILYFMCERFPVLARGIRKT